MLKSANLWITALFILSAVSATAGEPPFVGTREVEEQGQRISETIPQPNTGAEGPLGGHLNGWQGRQRGPATVLGGTIRWSFQDPTAIGDQLAIDANGFSPVTAWTLNNERVSRYTAFNSTPLWQFITNPDDGRVDISSDGAVIAAAAARNFYLLNPTTGSVTYQMTLPDSLQAAQVSVSRDGSRVILLANALPGSLTARAYAFDTQGTPAIAWTKDVPQSQISSWMGANFSADGSKVVINGRFHLYVLNSSDGSPVWDNFLDNSESPVAISGDGMILATADLSGFIQARVYDASAGEYNRIWQYRVPPGAFTNWAFSVGISADGGTIVAGTLIFFSSGNDGSVLAFDTYGDGTPLWIYGGTGDAVESIAVSDDGRVAAAVTWGDLAHTLPDLLIFDVATGTPTFELNTPGSLFAVDITPDGRRVFAGGKAVHARVFGNGGLLYLVDIDLGGGAIAGNIDLAGTNDDSGVLVEAIGSGRSAVTDANGDYLIENIPAGSADLRARKPGYEFGAVSNVTVTSGDTTQGINLALNAFTATPPTPSASQSLPGTILITWGPAALLSNDPLLISRITDPDFAGGDGLLFPTHSARSEPLRRQPQTPAAVSASPPADSVGVYRALFSGGPYQRIAAVPTGQNSYSDSSAQPLRDYYYVLSLFNNSGESVYSAEAMGRVSDTLLTFDFDAPQQTSAPVIDGALSPGEWDDAFVVDVSDLFGYFSGTPKPQGSALLYFKFDDSADMLYVGGEDFLNPTLDNNEGFGLYFDDNHNRVFEPADALPVFLEGNFWAYWHPGGSDLRFRPIYANGAVGTVITIANAEVAFSDGSGHLQGEVAIPLGFLEGYQVQIYSPERTVGLGAFIVARESGNAIFNGWWPQTMNNIFNPQYFGDVGINANLVAPPKIPADITVSRQGNALSVSWTDPGEGLNNDPLPAPPTIHLQRNGQPFTTVAAGVQTFLDTSVVCTGWYQYELQASVQVDTTTLTGPLSAPHGAFACSEPELVPIRYDDESWESFFVVSFNYDNNKFGVRFTPSFYPARVVRLETVVNSTAEFDFTIQADEGGLPGAVLAGPYRVHSSSPVPGSTVQLTVPGTEPPDIHSGDFWAVINYLPASPGAPGIGVDTNPPNANRGMYYTDTDGWVNFTFGNLMLTAYFTSPLVGVEEPLGNGLPLTFDLKPNYPNPFNPSTTLRYQLAAAGQVDLEIFNSLGQRVRRLVGEHAKAGFYEAQWDGRDDNGKGVASGVYIYRLRVSQIADHRGDFLRAGKMLLLK